MTGPGWAVVMVLWALGGLRVRVRGGVRGEAVCLGGRSFDGCEDAAGGSGEALGGCGRGISTRADAEASSAGGGA